MCAHQDESTTNEDFLLKKIHASHHAADWTRETVLTWAGQELTDDTSLSHVCELLVGRELLT